MKFFCCKKRQHISLNLLWMLFLGLVVLMVLYNGTLISQAKTHTKTEEKIKTKEKIKITRTLNTNNKTAKASPVMNVNKGYCSPTHSFRIQWRNDSAIEMENARKWLQKFDAMFSPFSFTHETIEKYIVNVEGLQCFKEGTDFEKTAQNATGCKCLVDWFGRHCSVPRIACEHTKELTFSLRSKPRRIIQTFPFLNEWAMLRHRLHDTGDIVDAFIITEGIYTGYGDPKNISFLPRLFADDNGFPHGIGKKIIPRVMNYFPKSAMKNGWEPETHIRNFAFRSGHPEELAGLVADDDIILLTDADEVPSRESLLFLKLHDDIPEPYNLNLKKTVYGFFWREGEWIMQAGMTFRMFRTLFKSSPNLIRRRAYLREIHGEVDDYYKNNMRKNTTNSSSSIRRGPFNIGSRSRPAGFHCSWCTEPLGIQTKLLSAINEDFPRWGDYPTKCTLSYLDSLIAQGRWFNERNCFTDNTDKTRRHKKDFAPSYIVNNPQEFSYLLDKPTLAMNLTSPACRIGASIDHGVFLKNWHRMNGQQLTEAMQQCKTEPTKDLLEVVTGN